MNIACQKIGVTLRGIRLKRGLSQEEFSQITGVHRTYISPLENGLKNPSVSTIYGMLKSLNISLRDFFEMAEL
jgi:transcriptional regulator with XRE-family HTH domain